MDKTALERTTKLANVIGMPQPDGLQLLKVKFTNLRYATLPFLILIYIPEIHLDPDITSKIGYTIVKVTCQV